MLALPCAVGRCAPGAAATAGSSGALPPPPPAFPLACRPRRLGLPRPASLRSAARPLAPPLRAAGGKTAGERAPAQAAPPAEGDPLREADAPVRSSPSAAAALPAPASRRGTCLGGCARHDATMLRLRG